MGVWEKEVEGSEEQSLKPRPVDTSELVGTPETTNTLGPTGRLGRGSPGEVSRSCRLQGAVVFV